MSETKKKYNVTGMSCAACQAHVEKAVSSVEGVSSCEVSLLTNSMQVTGNASSEAVIKAVVNAGYGASVSDGGSGSVPGEESLKDKTTPVLKKRLILSVIFLLILMYFSMGVMMLGWPAPFGIGTNMVALGIVEMVLAAIVMIINGKFFTSGIKSLVHLAPNMDTLVAMGSGVSFLYSVYVLINMACGRIHHGSLYFESAAMIVTLITIGKLLESISKGRTTDALKGLMKLAPKTAVVIKDGEEVTVGIDEVKVGDVFAVRPGGSIPVDGVIIEGMAAVDESALTGESVPVDKAEGDRVSAATINRSGFIKCRAEKVGEDTTLSQIIRLVSDAASSKAPIARIADKVSGVFVTAVIIIAAIVFLIWMLIGEELPAALTRAITVLVVSCPCALGLATPVAIMVGSGVAAKNGILFKSASSLEETGKMNIAVIDKTGTLTKGMPEITDVVTADGNAEEFLKIVYALEQGSEHPLGRACAEYCKSKGISALPAEEFKVTAGRGVTGKINGKTYLGGNSGLTGGKLADGLESAVRKVEEDGKTPMFFASEDGYLGMMAAADPLREDSPEAVKELKNLGLKVIMLTGDNERTANAIGRKAGVDGVIAGVLPDGKEQVIRRLQKQGKVIMIGDGINDAPALTRADIGISVGSGTDIAVDASDVVLMKATLKDAAAAIRISRKTVRNIHENLFWAFFYNILLIPVAAGAYMALGINMSPVFGAAAMSISSFTVCMNALRLNLVRPYDASHDRAVKYKANEIAEDKEMTKTMKIEGMMCGHCEASVKKALEAVEGVELAEVSHKEGTAVVTVSGEVSDDILKKAVEDKDYKVISIS